MPISAGPGAARRRDRTLYFGDTSGGFGRYSAHTQDLVDRYAKRLAVRLLDAYEEHELNPSGY